MKTFRSVIISIAVGLLPTLIGCGETHDEDSANAGDEGASASSDAEIESQQDPLVAATPCGAKLLPYFSHLAGGDGRYVTFRVVAHAPAAITSASAGVVSILDGTLETYTPAQTRISCTLPPERVCMPVRTPSRIEGNGDLTVKDGFGACAASGIATVKLDGTGQLSVLRGARTVIISNVECLDGNFYGVGNDKVLYSMSFSPGTLI
jgi:hypothetical protein